MNVIASGTDATSNVTIGKSTYMLKLGVHSGSSAVVVLNGQSVYLNKTTGYEDFYGDYPTFEITSGHVDWVAIG